MNKTVFISIKKDLKVKISALYHKGLTQPIWMQFANGAYLAKNQLELRILNDRAKCIKDVVGIEVDALKSIIAIADKAETIPEKQNIKKGSK